MASGRRFSSSSFPRYYIKMVRRFTGIIQGRPELAMVTSYAIAANWLNGFAPYSELRYKILPILEKYRIPRGLADGFMAFAQHAYKRVVKEKNADPEELFDWAVQRLIGNDTQSEFWGDKLDDVLGVIAEILKLVGINTEIV